MAKTSYPGSTGTRQTHGLARGISLPALFTFSFGTIIGVGWIIVLGSWLGGAGSMGAVIAFIGGAILMTLVGLCYAEVSTAFPSSGGELVYAYNIFGTRLAFVAGWFLLLIYIAVTAFEAVAVGWILSVLLPATRGPELYSIAGQPVHAGSLVIGLALMALMGWLNYRGGGASARFQSVMTVILVALTVVFVFAGFWSGKAENLEPLFITGAEAGWAGGILAILVTTPFWFAGFNVIPQGIAERAPGTSLRVAGLLIALAVMAAAVFYILVILAAALSAPRTVLLESSLPAAAAFEAAFGSRLMRDVVLLAGLMGLLTTWNAVYFAGTRVLFALGNSHLIPPMFGRVSSRFGSPVLAVLAIGVIGGAMALLGPGVVNPIVGSVGICFVALFILVCIGLIRLRRVNPELPRPFRLPFGIPIAVLTIALSLPVLVYGILEPYGSDGVPIQWIILVTWALLGVAAWFAGSGWRRGISDEERTRRINDTF